MKTDIILGLDELIGDIEPIRDPEGRTLNHLKWMVTEMMTKEFSDGKLNRWVGYIQGQLVLMKLTTLEKERERNR